MSARPRLGVLLAALAAFTAGAVPAASAKDAHPVPKAPHTAVLDGTRLQQTKIRLDRGDPQLRRTAKALTARADRWLNQGPWTVVDKPRPAPGGDIHDYLSQAPYW
jgi:hypothetical protein